MSSPFHGSGGGGGDGLPSLSAHSDILSVTTVPSTATSLHAFIEEIKRRGRVAVSSRDLTGAEALYGKGIDVLLLRGRGPSSMESATAAAEECAYNDKEWKRDMAILRSNRSLVRLQMGHTDLARTDAQLACRDDPTYVKAHWRYGQACVAAAATAEALCAFEMALGLEPANKALQKEVEGLRRKKEREEDAAAAAAATAEEEERDMQLSEEFAMTMMKTKTMKDGTTKASETAAPTQKEQNPVSIVTEDSMMETTKMEEEDEESALLFTKSDHVRGYKIRSDGKKTSYFHREISEDAKLLIGDIAPKKLVEDGTTTKTAIPNNSALDVSAQLLQQQPQMEGTSVWNKAGTWEERDVTPWAKETLTKALLGAQYVLPSSSPLPGSKASVYDVSKLDGHASYATVRGKKRYMYEFTLTIKWEFDAVLDCENGIGGEKEQQGGVSQCVRGEMTFPDIDTTVEPGEGYDIVNYTLDDGGAMTPPGIAPVLDRFVRQGGLRDVVHVAIDDWVKLFRITY